MLWRNPLAWLALGALAVPIAVHFLSRRRFTPLLFPSVRFLAPASAHAVRLRRPSDGGLLALRAGMVVAAVAALADPLVLTPWRQSAWQARVSRAVVVDAPHGGQASGEPGGRSPEVVSLLDDSMASTVVAGPLPTAVADAVTFLEGVPPSRREIVVVSELLDGRLDLDLVRGVPAGIGVRFEQATGPARDADRLVFARSTAGVERWTVTSTAADGVHVAAYEPRGSIDADTIIALRAPAGDRDDAAAARAAALTMGGPIEGPRPLTWIVIGTTPDAASLDDVGPASPTNASWLARLAHDAEAAAIGASCAGQAARGWPVPMPEGLWPLVRTDDGGVVVLGGETDGRLAIVSRADPRSSCGAALIARALTLGPRQQAPPVEALTPWPADRLASVARDAAPPGAADLGRADDSDARWLWLLVLGLLAVETWHRRRLDAGAAPHVTSAGTGRQEVDRVA